MRVLLIATRIDYARFLPLGVAYVAAFIEKNDYAVSVYDEIPMCKPFKEYFCEYDPDVVGISCMTSTYTKACDYAKKIKSIKPDIPIVFGGIHPTSAINETINEIFVDYVVFGEGELTIVELLKELTGNRDFKKIKGLAYKSHDKVVINEKRDIINDINSLPMPARHLFNMDYYVQRWNWPRGYWLKTANMMSSRGCPYDCIFCASKVMFGQKVRARSVKNTVDEVEDLVKQYGFECISFSDDTFSINKKRAIEICREIVKRRLNVKLRVQLRANTVWEDLIEEFKKAGCIHVDIGAESGSSKILETLKKGITVEQIKNAVSIIKNRKIKCGVTFIIGTLGEMYEDVELSKKLAIDLDADYTQFFIMTPYPGTPLYNIAKKNNLFSGEINFEDYRHGGFELKPILNVEISKKKLIELQDNLNKQFLGKIVRSYMLQPKFITDLLYLFTKKPLYLFIFIKAILRTRSLGKSLKIIMPHQI